MKESRTKEKKKKEDKKSKNVYRSFDSSTDSILPRKFSLFSLSRLFLLSGDIFTYIVIIINTGGET